MSFLPRYASEVAAKAFSADHRRGLLNAWVDKFAGGGLLNRTPTV